MGSLSIWHWLIVGAVLLLVFGGRGKISDMMGDVAKGIKAFKKGMSEDETAEAAPKSEGAKSEGVKSEGVKTEAAKPDAAPSKKGMGEGQKPVTQAYKDNWNAIFGEKKKKR